MHPDPKPITINPATRPSRPEDSGNPRQYEAAMKGWRAEHDAWKASADPVVVVGFELPFDDVFRLMLQILVVQTMFAAIVLLLLRLFGVI